MVLRMERKTLEELVKEHGFNVQFSNKDSNKKMCVHSESKYWKDTYICELQDGHVYPVLKKSTAYIFEKPKVKRAQYLLIPKDKHRRPNVCDMYFKDEDDFLRYYDGSDFEKIIRLTETERDFDW